MVEEAAPNWITLVRPPPMVAPSAPATLATPPPTVAKLPATLLTLPLAPPPLIVAPAVFAAALLPAYPPMKFGQVALGSRRKTRAELTLTSMAFVVGSSQEVR